MVYFPFLVLLFAVGGRSDPIVRGLIVNAVKYPYVVHLKITSTERTTEFSTECGGSILSRHSILTAAHCLDDFITGPEAEVHAGVTYNNLFGRTGQTRAMESYEIHPDYSSKHIDLAVLHLKAPLDLHDGSVAVAAFSTAKLNDYTRIVGWGLMEYNERTDVQRHTIVRIIMNEQCREYPHGQSYFLCLQDPIQQSTFCNGDSGGPTIIKHKVVGVMIESYKGVIKTRNGKTITVCSTKGPAIAVKIYPHMKWIRETMK